MRTFNRDWEREKGQACPYVGRKVPGPGKACAARGQGCWLFKMTTRGLRDPVRPALHCSKEYPHTDGRREDMNGFGGVGLSGYGGRST